MISAISPVQKSEVECKTVKLSVADKNETEIETLYLYLNTKTS